MNKEWKRLIDMWQKRKNGEKIPDEIKIYEIVASPEAHRCHLLIFDIEKKIYTQGDVLKMDPIFTDDIPKSWPDFRSVYSNTDED